MIDQRKKHVNLNLCISLFLFSILLISYLISSKSDSFAQESENLDWTYPVRIPQHDDDSKPPVLVADLNNTIHSFTADLSRNSAIAYRQWTKDNGWSVPVDVVLPPKSGTVTIFGAEIDSANNLHLVIYYGIEGDAALFHVQAPIYLAQSASAWSEPLLITDQAGPISEGHFTSDHQENLHVVYAGLNIGQGLYEQFSADGGLTWSEPQLIYLSAGNNLLPAAVETHLDPAGNLHAVWSIWSAELGAGVELFYTQKPKDTGSWFQPTLLAKRDAGDYESDWGVVTTTTEEVIVLYQDDFPATKWMRKSTDNGLTWSEPERPWPHIGEYENGIFLKDGEDRLHIILGNRDGDCCHGLWHGRYIDGHWQDLQPVISGPKTIDFDPSKPSAIIGQGNLIFSAWWMDTSDRNGAWYSYGYLDDIEPLPVQPITMPGVNDATEEQIEVAELVEIEVEEPTILNFNSTQPDDTTPSTAIMLGIGISLFGLLLALAGWYLFYRLR